MKIEGSHGDLITLGREVQIGTSNIVGTHFSLFLRFRCHKGIFLDISIMPRMVTKSAKNSNCVAIIGHCNVLSYTDHPTKSLESRLLTWNASKFELVVAQYWKFQWNSFVLYWGRWTKTVAFLWSRCRLMLVSNSWKIFHVSPGPIQRILRANLIDLVHLILPESVFNDFNLAVNINEYFRSA